MHTKYCLKISNKIINYLLLIIDLIMIFMIVGMLYEAVKKIENKLNSKEKIFKNTIR